jgi:hypothetical protein
LTCTISPSSPNLTGSSPATATLTVSSTAQVSATPRWTQWRVPPSFRLPVQWPWLLTGFLALAALVNLATARRSSAWLFATAFLVGGWAACGGGGGGGGGTSAPPPAPVVSLSPAGLAFSQENMGSTTAPQTITLSNTGNAPLSISSIALEYLVGIEFAQTNNCGGGLAAGSNCAISVTFTPQATGSRSASLVITDNAALSPQTVSLTGTGIPPATQPGDYSVSVNGQSGGAVHWVQPPLSVTVQ